MIALNVLLFTLLYIADEDPELCRMTTRGEQSGVVEINVNDS